MTAADERGGSLLHPGGAVTPTATAPPSSFADLGLELVASALLSGLAAFRLEDWFWTPPGTAAAVVHRQEAIADLGRGEVRDAVRRFSDGLATARTRLATARSYPHPLQRQLAHLDGATTYTAAVTTFAARLHAAAPASRALGDLAARLTSIAASPSFTRLAAAAGAAREAVDAVRYQLHIASDRVQVTRAAGTDYSADVAATFARLGDGAGHSHVTRPPGGRTEPGHVEAAILERVAALHPHAFGLLDRFASEHPQVVDPGLVLADRELQFLGVGLALAERLRAAGLPACWPEVSETDQTIELRSACDPALALLHREVVGNDVVLAPHERIAVVTGPNQGGKTTFARMIGAIAHLAALGFPVPAERARLPLPDAVLTHVGRAEDLADLRGALEDDLLRLRAILDAATPDSLVILNELFSSTTVADAAELSRATLARLQATGCRCIWVTFLTELAREPGVVSLVSQVDPADPTVRTFRVERQDAGGPTWAETLAVAVGLDRDSLRARLGR